MIPVQSGGGHERWHATIAAQREQIRSLEERLAKVEAALSGTTVTASTRSFRCHLSGWRNFLDPNNGPRAIVGDYRDQLSKVN